MEPRRMQEVLDALLEWNLIESTGPAYVATTRWRAALERAAEEIRDENARSGPAQGHPVRLEVERAWADLALAPAGELSEDFVLFLTALEMERAHEGKKRPQDT